MADKKSILYLFAILFVKIGLAQSATGLKLDSLFTILDANSQAMGSMAISKNGEIVYTKVIGHSLYKPDKKIRANERTKYRIGSISKVFTAVIVFQLIEEGKITLGSTLENYFPQLPNAEKIAVGNLLNHTSGIPNVKKINARQRPRTQKEMLKIISQKKGWTLPGAGSSYSNSNFLLLGYMIEKITGKPFSDVLNERIVSKIGLTDTYFGQRTRIENNESFSYRRKVEWRVQRQTNLSIPGASAGIVSTPSDLVKFIEALFSKKLVSQGSLDKMKTISNEEYGMGLFLFKLDNKKAYGHPGGIDRFESVVAYFPEDSLAIAYCSNGQVYPVKDIVISSLNIYFGKKYSIPEFKPATIKNVKLKRYEGTYTNNQYPMTITVYRDKKILVAKPAEYPSPFELYPVSVNTFRCDEINVVVEFDLANNQMKLTREGRVLNLTKQN